MRFYDFAFSIRLNMIKYENKYKHVNMYLKLKLTGFSVQYFN